MPISRAKLSGSTDGKPIKVAATSIGSGTTIHTATTSTSAGVWDEVYLYVTNTDGSAVTLTLSWGATTDPDGLISKTVSIPALTGPVCIVPGLILQNGLAILAAGGSANLLLITGYVNKIT